jgi:mono/diheme cytochrome c family protein
MKTAAAAAALFFLSPFRAAAAEPAAEAVTLFNSHCATCHGKDGKGATPMGKKMGIDDLTEAKWQAEHPDAKVKAAMENGAKREKDGKTFEMKSFKEKLSAEEMDAILTVVRSFGGAAPAKAEPANPEPAKGDGAAPDAGATEAPRAEPAKAEGAKAAAPAKPAKKKKAPKKTPPKPAS